MSTFNATWVDSVPVFTRQVDPDDVEWDELMEVVEDLLERNATLEKIIAERSK